MKIVWKTFLSKLKIFTVIIFLITPKIFEFEFFITKHFITTYTIIICTISKFDTRNSKNMIPKIKLILRKIIIFS